MFKTSEDATNAYRTYLNKVNTMDCLTTNRLADAMNEWQTLRDSVFSCLDRDTTVRAHYGYMGEVQALHDSIRSEFIRLSASRQRTFADVLFIRRETSKYKQDEELMRSAALAEDFFESLDTIPTYQKNAQGIVYAYRSFLDKTLETGLNSKEEMLSFIKEEDRLFRSYLVHLPELAYTDLSAITDNTEKCCHTLFLSAMDGKLPYDDALIYMAKRTNRRIILNAGTCRDDIDKGKVKTEAQVRAYIWMLLQPYITLDTFSVAVLSDIEYARFMEIAEQTPQMIAGLNGIIGTDNGQYNELPCLLIKIMINSI